MLEIRPVKGIDAVVEVPGSKSYTNRALVIGSLADGKTVINNALFSDDTRYMISSMKRLGIDISAHTNENRITVTGGHYTAGAVDNRRTDLFTGNAGTAMRFLTAMLTLYNGAYLIDGTARMRERPIGDLLDGLAQLGADAASANGTGCPPVLINADSALRGTSGLNGGRCRIRGDASSQYISAILMIAPYCNTDVAIEIIGDLVSKTYVDMTLAIMDDFGVEVKNRAYREFIIRTGRKYQSANYYVEPDASSASYFLAAAAIAGGRITVKGIGNDSVQGDAGFAGVLQRMGCRVRRGADYIEVCSGELKGIDIDMSDMPDVAQTLAAVAVFANGKTRVRNVGNLRIKETDRISAVTNELRKIGVRCVEYDDGFEIEPSAVRPAEIETYDDHRMAMSFSLIGLRVKGMKIIDPGCVTKTFPGFFEKLASLI